MKNKVGRPATGRIGWWSIPLYEREREQRSIMHQHRFDQEDFFAHILSNVKPIDENEYISTCINEALRLIDKRVEYRVHHRNKGKKTTYSDIVIGGFELTTRHHEYQNGFFNETAMEWYLMAKVSKEVVKWLNGDVNRGKWVDKINDNEFPDLDRSYQPFVKFLRTVLNKREVDFKRCKLNLLTNDFNYVYRDEKINLEKLRNLAKSE